MARVNRLDPVPHPPKIPVLGNLLSLDVSAPLQNLMDLAREYGPIYWLDMMGTPVVVVSGFSLVDEVCDEKRFDKSTRGFLRRLRALSHGLFTSDTHEPTWSKPHNILLPNFSQRAMQRYHPMMLDLAEQLVQKWARQNPDDEIDVVRDMTALTLDTIGLCGFGYRFNSFYREGFHPFVDAMVRSLETAQLLRGLPLEDLVRKKQLQRLRADIRFMHKMVEVIIRDRRASGADIAAKPDLLSYMLAGVDKKTGERLDDRQIRDECIEFLIAGHETTSGLLSFATYFLLNHPDVLARATAEVDRVLGPDPTAAPTYAQVNQLTYVTQVLKESLRLWPTAAAFALYPLEDTVIGGQYKMKRRYHIVVLGPMLHRDKSVWGERAEAFNPDNFSREAEAARPANAYKPFGNGRRACIGRQFAMQEATLVMGMVLQRFELIDHTRYQLKVKETLTIKPDGLKIKVRPRTDVKPSRAARPVEIAAATAEPAAPSPIPQHATPLLVLFGSNMGTAEEFARHVAEAGEGNGFATTLAGLDDYAGRLPRAGAVAIVAASYNGAPPDNAAEFCRWLRDGKPVASLEGVNYTVFGCGNRDWASTYQAVPRLIDERLGVLGARRIHPRGEGDAREDLDGAFQDWHARLWPSMAKELAIDADLAGAAEAKPLYAVDVVPAPQASPLVGSLGATALQVSSNRELQAKDGPHPSDRSTRHIEILLPAAVSYRSGDHLSVVPRNSEALVERVANRFGFERDAHIRLRNIGGRKTFLPVDETVSIHRLLADYVELQHVATRKQIQTLAEHTACPATKPKLLEFVGDDEASSACYRSEVLTKRRSVIDLLEEFPACQLPFSAYLEMLPLMTPRYYSISSSPLSDPGRCSITVAVVEGPARSGRGTFQGVCSNFLRRQSEGSVVHGFVKETTAGFRLPDDPKRPIIMIGPGTGLAPFRGFLRERAALTAQGKPMGDSMLFFGCRHPQQDFIYADELEALAEQGLTRLCVAFSRLNGQKAYVQDHIKANWDRLWNMIERDAVIYVCGDGSRMEPDVRRTLLGLYRQQVGADAAGAETWLNDMIGRNRYVLDVWAGN